MVIPGRTCAGGTGWGTVAACTVTGHQYGEVPGRGDHPTLTVVGGCGTAAPKYAHPSVGGTGAAPMMMPGDTCADGTDWVTTGGAATVTGHQYGAVPGRGDHPTWTAGTAWGSAVTAYGQPRVGGTGAAPMMIPGKTPAAGGGWATTGGAWTMVGHQ
jgi:hypothetical protein